LLSAHHLIARPGRFSGRTHGTGSLPTHGTTLTFQYLRNIIDYLIMVIYIAEMKYTEPQKEKP